MQNLMFNNYCPGFYILISNFIVGLKSAIIKIGIKKEYISKETEFE